MLKHYTKKFNEGFYDNHPLAKFVVGKLSKNINMESLNGKDISYSWENLYPFCDKLSKALYDNDILAKFVVEKLLKNINMESLNGKDISYSWENFYKNIYDFALKTKEYMGEYESVSELFNLYPFCDKLSKALYGNDIRKYCQWINNLKFSGIINIFELEGLLGKQNILDETYLIVPYLVEYSKLNFVTMQSMPEYENGPAVSGNTGNIQLNEIRKIPYVKLNITKNNYRVGQSYHVYIDTNEKYNSEKNDFFEDILITLKKVDDRQKKFDKLVTDEYYRYYDEKNEILDQYYGKDKSIILEELDIIKSKHENNLSELYSKYSF